MLGDGKQCKAQSVLFQRKGKGILNPSKPAGEGRGQDNDGDEGTNVGLLKASEGRGWNVPCG